MSVVHAIALVGILASLTYYLAATLLSLRFARRGAEAVPALPKVAPRVAILKPLHGLTPNLPANVISYFELDYPRKEYVFGVSSYEDAAAGVPLGLKARYHFLDIALTVGEEPGCANHKVAALIKMAERAPKAEIFVISDADVSVEYEHLKRVIGELCADEETGIVTCLYRARPQGGLGSRMEALYVNTDFAPMAIVSDAIEPMRHAFGATIAIRRRALETIGGFAALRDLLADDFFLGRMVAERGFKVKLSSSIVTINSEEHSFVDFWNHQLRWARTYRTVRPLSLATLLIHGPFWALMALLSSGFSASAVGLLGAVLAARIAMAAIILRYALKVPELVAELWLLLFKDLAMTAVWFASLLGNRVTWGGRRFVLRPAGKMEEVH